MTDRYMVTCSLLNSWLYMLRDEYSEDPLQDFLRVLRREETEPTPAIQDGIDFENLVTAIIANDADEEHPWYDGAAEIAGIINGAVLQYKAKRETVIGGRNVLLYGRLDALKAGHVYDIKFCHHYDVGKYVDSAQHPMYLDLIPEARDFTYLVFNGSAVWQERYTRDDTQPIEPIVAQFFEWLKDNGLDETYTKYWKAN